MAKGDEIWVELTEKNIDKYDLPTKCRMGREELLLELETARAQGRRVVKWIRS